MNDSDKPKYACPHCGATVFCSQPDSYAVFEAEGDSLYFRRTELTDEGISLHCQKCYEDAPEEFASALR